MDLQEEIDTANAARNARLVRRERIIRLAMLDAGLKRVSVRAHILRGCSRATVKDRTGLDLPELDQ